MNKKECIKKLNKIKNIILDFSLEKWLRSYKDTSWYKVLKDQCNKIYWYFKKKLKVWKKDFWIATKRVIKNTIKENTISQLDEIILYSNWTEIKVLNLVLEKYPLKYGLIVKEDTVRRVLNEYFSSKKNLEKYNGISYKRWILIRNV